MLNVIFFAYTYLFGMQFPGPESSKASFLWFPLLSQTSITVPSCQQIYEYYSVESNRTRMPLEKCIIRNICQGICRTSWQCTDIAVRNRMCSVQRDAFTPNMFIWFMRHWIYVFCYRPVSLIYYTHFTSKYAVSNIKQITSNTEVLKHEIILDDT